MRRSTHYRLGGLVDDWTWQSISHFCHALMSTPGFTDWWAIRGDWFSDDFRDHIAETQERGHEYPRFD